LGRTVSATSTWRPPTRTAARWSRTGSPAPAATTSPRLIDYEDRYQPGARRFDVGERSDFAFVPVGILGLEQLIAWGDNPIAATLAAKTAAIPERGAGLGLGAVPGRLRAGHYLGLKFLDSAPQTLPERLAEERIYVSVQGDWLRVTPHLYNDEADLERLFAVLQTLL
jgi:hypothetical protein